MTNVAVGQGANSNAFFSTPTSFFDIYNGGINSYVTFRGTVSNDTNVKNLLTATSNANNVYIYAVPKLEAQTTLSSRTNYLNTAQKQLIVNDLANVKLTTSEIVINDPVFVSVDLGVRIADEILTENNTVGAFLEIERTVTAKANPQSLIDQVSNIFKTYFSTTNDNLGKLVSISDLTNQILAIQGINNIRTKRYGADGNLYVTPGLSLLIYNPVYSYNDIQVITQDLKLPYFKYPYLNDSLNFYKKITVVTPSIQFG
jgi:hypothetical protein